jgi:hypothetical protein
MASNLLYSPVPAYPAAASASHVQGEVKLSADVDRDGKVAINWKNPWLERNRLKPFRTAYFRYQYATVLILSRDIR